MQIRKIVSVTKTLHLHAIFFSLCINTCPMDVYTSLQYRTALAYHLPHFNSFVHCCYFSNFPLGPRFLRLCIEDLSKRFSLVQLLPRRRCHHFPSVVSLQSFCSHFFLSLCMFILLLLSLSLFFRLFSLAHLQWDKNAC